jgi:flagellar P-ring protein FlgI
LSSFRPNAVAKMRIFSGFLGLIWLLFGTTTIVAGDEQLRIRDICRLKGQEVNTIHGLGLVVGLKGTGDDKITPMRRSLAQMIRTLNGNISVDAQGIPKLDEIEKVSNVAMVYVTAEIPAKGAQQGDVFDCTVSALGAKSLEGGMLVMAPLVGPRTDIPKVFALAHGSIRVNNRAIPTNGVVHGGCKMETTVRNRFVENNKITLILDDSVSSFWTAQTIEDEINTLNGGVSGLNSQRSAAEPVTIAQAIDAMHIVVEIPEKYRESPVKFVSLIMETQLRYLQNQKRVVINEKDGVVVIGEDVLISPVAITHKNLSIEARPGSGGFVGLDIENPAQPRTKLKNLTDALNSLEVPAEDVIAIIKALKVQGVLYGELIVH